jgi:hypothetical protein
VDGRDEPGHDEHWRYVRGFWPDSEPRAFHPDDPAFSS